MTKEQIIESIRIDNRANGLYANLAQFTNGYDTAINRVINLIEELAWIEEPTQQHMATEPERTQYDDQKTNS